MAINEMEESNQLRSQGSVSLPPLVVHTLSSSMKVILESKFLDSFQLGLLPNRMHTASIVYATICSTGTINR